jgi:hypothetical protein
MPAPESSVDGMLHLLKVNPSLMPEAPAQEPEKQIARRVNDEVHQCLRCGQRARFAFVAHTDWGNRWLDLCAECAHWLRRTA